MPNRKQPARSPQPHEAPRPVSVLSRRQAVALFATALAGTQLAGARPAAAQRRGGVLRISATSNPSSLDPMTGGAGSDHAFLYPLYDTLITFDPKQMTPLPGLAERWDYPEPTKLVLTIRPGIVFHDDTPCDAQAVKFNLDRNRQDARSNIKADLATIDNITVESPTQVTLHLKQPDSALPMILTDRAGMMVSPKAVQEAGDQSNRKPCGAGPWKLVSWADNEKVTYTRHTRYWQEGRPYLDGLEMSVIPDVNTGLRSVLSGSNELVYNLSPQQIRLIERSRDLSVVNTPSLYCQLIYLNIGRPPFNDLRVRQAFNLAINREDYQRATTLGTWEIARTLLPRAHWAFNDDDSLQAFTYDPDRAKALLAAAGHTNGIEINLLGYSDQRSTQRQEALIEHLSKVGIRARFSVGSIADTSARFFAQRSGDGLLSGWTGRPDPSLSYSLMFGKDSYFNPGRVEGAPGLQGALEATRAVPDQAQRKARFAVVQKMAAEQALYVPLLFQTDTTAITKHVHGFTPNLLGKPRFNDIYLEG